MASPFLIAADMAPPPRVTGFDLAKGRDLSAMALKSREGTRVVLTTGGEAVQLDRAWINGLDASRKDARACLAMALETIASARGATTTTRQEPANPGWSGAGIHLDFRCNGVGAMVDIDNLHGGLYGLVHWFNDYTAGRRATQNFSGRFSVAVGGGIGRPHHKATSCPPDWYSLAMALDAGLYLAARGQAFEVQAEEI